jgi:hypothetical protein
MLDQTLTYLTEFASAVGRGFMLPGDLLLSGFAWIAPQSAEVLSFGTGRSVATLVLALFGWTMIVIIGLLLSRLCRAVARQMNAMLRILVWRIKMLLGNLKTRMLWKYREYFPHKTTQTETVSQTQFDDLDIAVLASMSRQGPGMASSAPELAEKIGSTDGFENYRLTESGLALIAVCERQATARASVVSV